MLVQYSFTKDNAIHIKNGGGSFKLSYKIPNVSHPNSTNTVEFSIFEAKDYGSNVKIGWVDFKNK